MSAKILTIVSDCPDGACEWCYEQGDVVDANGNSGDSLCDECEFERSVCDADLLHDCMKEG